MVKTVGLLLSSHLVGGLAFLSDPYAKINPYLQTKEIKMARSLSVKVPTSAIVEMVENKIAEIEKEIKEFPAKQEQFDKEQELYKSKVVGFVSEYLAKNLSKIGYENNSVIRLSNYNGRVELSFNADSIENFPKPPQAPKKPNSQQWYGREYTYPLEMLEKNLRVLKMTNQETVNASTYSSVMDLL